VLFGCSIIMTQRPPRRKSRSRPVAACVVVSDLHCGCRFGLCPSGRIPLDGGGTYTQSSLQRFTWRLWEHFWNKWVPQVVGDRRFCIVVNGDVIDGTHHGTVTQISQNLADQLRIAQTVLSPLVKRVDGRLYIVRGTEAHAGASAQEEDKLCEMLRISPATFGLWLQMGGKLLHFAHHIGSAATLQTEPLALAREMSNALMNAARWRGMLPDCLVRSHRHTNMEIRIATSRGPVVAFCTAGWQLKTPYLYRIAVAKTTIPQIGGSVIIVEDSDIISRHFVYALRSEKAARI